MSEIAPVKVLHCALKYIFSNIESQTWNESCDTMQWTHLEKRIKKVESVEYFSEETIST